MPRVIVWALAISLAIVAVPIAAVALGLVVFPIDFVLKMVGLTSAGVPGSPGPQAFLHAIEMGDLAHHPRGTPIFWARRCPK